MTQHWHVASGLAGYGPDGSDGYSTAMDPEQLADLIRDELQQWADFERDGADGYAEAGQYEEAWHLLKHSDETEVLGENFDNKRMQAPGYVDNAQLWHDTVLRLVAENFAYDVNDGRNRVYAWLCEAVACEHLTDDD